MYVYFVLVPFETNRLCSDRTGEALIHRRVGSLAETLERDKQATWQHHRSKKDTSVFKSYISVMFYAFVLPRSKRRLHSTKHCGMLVSCCWQSPYIVLLVPRPLVTGFSGKCTTRHNAVPNMCAWLAVDDKTTAPEAATNKPYICGTLQQYQSGTQATADHPHKTMEDLFSCKDHPTEQELSTWSSSIVTVKRLDV